MIKWETCDFSKKKKFSICTVQLEFFQISIMGKEKSSKKEKKVKPEKPTAAAPTATVEKSKSSGSRRSSKAGKLKLYY